VDRFQELIPAYALDALDEPERHELEEHLATCDRCRSELRAYRESVSSLSYAAPLLDPPAGLRARILHEAREELTPRAAPRRSWARRRRLVVGVPVLAAAAAAAAIAVAVLSDHGPSNGWIRTATNRVALSGGTGVVVVAGDRGALLTSLTAAPPGRTYQAWIIRGAAAPIPAGTFRAGGSPVVLGVPVRHGDTVAVTVEPARGSQAPTSKPIASAKV
jgi:anti-sigma factor RsiW